MIRIEMIHVPEDRFDVFHAQWARLTYTELLVPDKHREAAGLEPLPVATFIDGFWVQPNGTKWTDILITLEGELSPRGNGVF